MDAPSFLTADQASVWLEMMNRVKPIIPVGEALPIRSNGVQVLENERLDNGMHRVKVARFGKEPDLPAGVPGSAKVFRWKDDEVPMFYLYAFWKKENESAIA